MKRPSVLLLGLIVITACRSVEDKEAAAWEQSYKAEQARAQTEIQRLKEGDRQAKAHFLERYRRYQCSREDVPQTDESKGPGHRFKSMQLGDHLALKLKLGKATYADGLPYGPTRTASRYQLFWDGKLVGEAESLFSTGNEDSSVNRIFYCPKDHTVVVFDDLCWSTRRFFVFAQSSKPDRTPKWTTKYFVVPDPPSNGPSPDMAEILGVGNGCIYMEVDGQPYAFPFDDFIQTKLEFTVG
ncbi:hypothetical protein [Prosthecobacter sp.]|uniref:hypothetical protein n=1 Tax=Prosthecobacter sp. TaxID=1965333 RepID=UPI002ABBF169|nr:hypothetical protein [Prosthecobacter sp.]MDZ4401311.1 hypothetical protein [Prosthecobacter sp.]